MFLTHKPKPIQKIIRKILIQMKFQSFDQLIEAIKTHPEFSNEIKLKRLKKQLELLSVYQNPETSIEAIQLTSIGIELQLRNKFRQSTYDYKMVLDFQYPFNRPFVFYLKKDSSYAQGKDLLDILLQGSNWGPSLMLSYFLDRIQSVSEIIRQNGLYQSKMLYHSNENYNKAFLQQMEIHFFDVEEYVWKYMLKSTKKRIMGLTNETLMLFSASKNNQNLILDFWKPISEISTAKASVSVNKKFNLEVAWKEGQKEVKMYFGGQSKIETILGYLNPIEMIERKIVQIEKNPNELEKGKYWEDNEEMVREFTQLIEYYSLKDSTKAQKFIKLMKELIVKFYEGEVHVETNQIKIQSKEIKT